MKELLQIKDLYKKYSKKTGIEKTNLVLFEGEIFCLLGPSGAGKTTLLNCISGFLKPDGGSVFLNGNEITKAPLESRNIGVIYQNYSLFEKLTVMENISFPLKARFYRNPFNYFKLNKSKFLNEIYIKVEKISKLVNIESHLNKLPSQLSGGEQQRVAIARSLIFNPEFLCFDEPLAALDANLKRNLLIEIKLLVKTFNKTLLYVTHDQDEAFRIADRIAILKEGRILQIGKPRELYQNPVNVFVADFLGDINFFDVNRIETLENEFKIYSNYNTEIFVKEIINKDDNKIGIRPENFILHYSKPLTNYYLTGMVLEQNTIKEISYIHIKLNTNEKILVKQQINLNSIQIEKTVYIEYCIDNVKIINK